MRRFSDWQREIEEILDITLLNKWLWIIIGSMAAIVILPFVAISIMLMSPSWLSAIITILIIIGGGVAGGYKEWLLHKHEQEKKVAAQDVIPFTHEKFSEKDKDYG